MALLTGAHAGRHACGNSHSDSGFREHMPPMPLISASHCWNVAKPQFLLWS
jgi:hypothetical protein